MTELFVGFLVIAVGASVASLVVEPCLVFGYRCCNLSTPVFICTACKFLLKGVALTFLASIVSACAQRRLLFHNHINTQQRLVHVQCGSASVVCAVLGRWCWRQSRGRRPAAIDITVPLAWAAMH